MNSSGCARSATQSPRTTRGKRIASIAAAKESQAAAQELPIGPISLDLSMAELLGRVATDSGDPTYSYIASTFVLDDPGRHFRQTGSAPNFQGGYVSLCTCKHRMRTRLPVSEWPRKWIAVFSSRTLLSGLHWLTCLFRVSQAFESHADLWTSREDLRAAKSAQLNYLGDLYQPVDALTGEDRFRPKKYLTPALHVHHKRTEDQGWENDISYMKQKAGLPRPALLVGEPSLCFLWLEPVVSLSRSHSRDYEKWPTLESLLGVLK